MSFSRGETSEDAPLTTGASLADRLHDLLTTPVDERGSTSVVVGLVRLSIRDFEVIADESRPDGVVSDRLSVLMTLYTGVGPTGLEKVLATFPATDEPLTCESFVLTPVDDER